MIPAVLLYISITSQTSRADTPNSLDSKSFYGVELDTFYGLKFNEYQPLLPHPTPLSSTPTSSPTSLPTSAPTTSSPTTTVYSTMQIPGFGEGACRCNDQAMNMYTLSGSAYDTYSECSVYCGPTYACIGLTIDSAWSTCDIITTHTSAQEGTQGSFTAASSDTTCSTPNSVKSQTNTICYYLSPNTSAPTTTFPTIPPTAPPSTETPTVTHTPTTSPSTVTPTITMYPTTVTPSNPPTASPSAAPTATPSTSGPTATHFPTGSPTVSPTFTPTTFNTTAPTFSSPSPPPSPYPPPCPPFPPPPPSPPPAGPSPPLPPAPPPSLPYPPSPRMSLHLHLPQALLLHLPSLPISILTAMAPSPHPLLHLTLPPELPVGPQMPPLLRLLLRFPCLLNPCAVTPPWPPLYPAATFTPVTALPRLTLPSPAAFPSTFTSSPAGAPHFVSGYPDVRWITYSEATLAVQLSEPGYVYYALTFAPADTPTRLEVINGTAAGGLAAAATGSINARSSYMTFSELWSILEAGQAYTVWLVAVDRSSTWSNGAYLTFSTTHAPPPPAPPPVLSAAVSLLQLEGYQQATFQGEVENFVKVMANTSNVGEEWVQVLDAYNVLVNDGGSRHLLQTSTRVQVETEIVVQGEGAAEDVRRRLSRAVSSGQLLADLSTRMPFLTDVIEVGMTLNYPSPSPPPRPLLPPPRPPLHHPLPPPPSPPLPPSPPPPPPPLPPPTTTSPTSASTPPTSAFSTTSRGGLHHTYCLFLHNTRVRASIDHLLEADATLLSEYNGGHGGLPPADNYPDNIEDTLAKSSKGSKKRSPDRSIFAGIRQAVDQPHSSQSARSIYLGSNGHVSQGVEGTMPARLTRPLSTGSGSLRYMPALSGLYEPPSRNISGGLSRSHDELDEIMNWLNVDPVNRHDAGSEQMPPVKVHRLKPLTPDGRPVEGGSDDQTQAQDDFGTTTQPGAKALPWDAIGEVFKTLNIPTSPPSNVHYEIDPPAAHPAPAEVEMGGMALGNQPLVDDRAPRRGSQEWLFGHTMVQADNDDSPVSRLTSL
ncbi:hypothetical protein CYMTET_43834 [Cymbomonas tetramitiformis]|uniref:Uncharacterized protein n=1 Tax=Cymbomonas tetramitiformis TaxID=36881 RepID=A0AAE0C326_9CHLO|nr:hypothetical protein CYMTET_43834 [Cymbomonas tetramitiformis]